MGTTRSSGGCSCGGIRQNQTPKKSFEAAAAAVKAGDPTTGFGMFLVPAPEIGPIRTKTVLVDGLEYDECVARGHLCIAFKWIHPGYVTFASVESGLKSTNPLMRCLTGGQCDDDGDCDIFCYCAGNHYCVVT